MGQKVGLLFPVPDLQFLADTLEEDLAFGPENLGLDPKEIEQRVDTALKMVSMEDYRKYPPGFLSGGQKQKAAIAALLASRPAYMVLDEPCTMMESQDIQGGLAQSGTLHDNDLSHPFHTAFTGGGGES